MSPKHLQNYVDEFVWRQNIRSFDMIDIMTDLVRGLVGNRLTYKQLIADNGLCNGGRYGF